MHQTHSARSVPSLTEAPTAVAPALAQAYPPAFDRDFIRVIPVLVPLLGVMMVLLTGLMWMMA